MSRSATSPATRLRKLEAALVKAKALKRGTVLSAEPMRQMLGVSWPTLRGWCDDIAGFEESGAFIRGDNGLRYEFKPVATVRFLVEHFKAEIAVRTKKAREVRRLVGGNRLDGLPDDFDLDEINKMIRTSALLREERQRAGELVDAAKLGDAVRRMITEMQQAGVKAAVQQDPTAQWPVEIREAFEDAFNNLLVVMGRAGEDCLRAIRGGAA